MPNLLNCLLCCCSQSENNIPDQSKPEGKDAPLLNSVSEGQEPWQKRWPNINPERIQHFQSEKEMEDGGTATLKQATYCDQQNNTHFVAVKAPKNDSDQLHFRNELDVLRRLQFNGSHINIITCYGYTTEADQPGLSSIILEMANRGDLRQIIKSKLPKFHSNSLSIAKQIAAGLTFMHEKGVIHRDLKPENIAIHDIYWSVRIIDFGSAKALPEGQTFADPNPYALATPEYAAPEQLSDHGHGTAVDIFAFAMVLWRMATDYGCHPYTTPAPGVYTLDKHPWYQAAKAGMRPTFATFNQKSPFTQDKYRDLITNMWHKRPDQRPTAPDIMRQLESDIQLGPQ